MCEHESEWEEPSSRSRNLIRINTVPSVLIVAYIMNRSLRDLMVDPKPGNLDNPCLCRRDDGHTYCLGKVSAAPGGVAALRAGEYDDTYICVWVCGCRTNSALNAGIPHYCPINLSYGSGLGGRVFGQCMKKKEWPCRESNSGLCDLALQPLGHWTDPTESSTEQTILSSWGKR